MISDGIIAALDGYRDLRDSNLEKMFLAIYGSPVMQAMVGLAASDESPRPRPGMDPERVALIQQRIAELKARIAEGGAREAAIRALVYIGMAGPGVDERTFNTLRQIRAEHDGLTLAGVQADPARAVLQPDARPRGGPRRDPEDVAGRQPPRARACWRPSAAPSHAAGAATGERAERLAADRNAVPLRSADCHDPTRSRQGAALDQVLRRRCRNHKHEKYNHLIARCKALTPVPCAVAHPCDESSLRGAVEAAQMGILKPILVGPKARIAAVAAQCGLDISAFEVVDAPHSEGVGRDRRAPGARGQGRDPDEGQPAHRRTDGRGGQARDRPAHEPPRQPLLHHGRAGDRPRADHHRRGGEHLPDAGGQGPHHAERDRPRPCAGHGRHPRSRSCRRWRRSIRRSSRPSRPPRCARWPTAARSPAACSTGRWRSTTRSTSAPRRSRRSSRPSPDRPTSWWCPTWRPATCWPRA